MFNNVTEEILWEQAPSSLKIKDTLTSQREYNGVERGQTERYLIALGRGVTDLFGQISSLFVIDDASELTNDKIDALLEKRGITFLKTTDENRDLIIHILDNLNEAYRLKGTELFYKWIVHKFFGWVVLRAYSLESLYLVLNKYDSTLYDNGDYNTQLYLFDNESIISNKIIIIVDQSDPLFLKKKGLLLELAKSWAMNIEFEFIEN